MITMQGMKSGLLFFLLSPLALAGNQWNVTLPGGNMRFQGIIIAESCRVEAGDQQMTVNMGQISNNYANPFFFLYSFCDGFNQVLGRFLYFIHLNKLFFLY